MDLNSWLILMVLTISIIGLIMTRSGSSVTRVERKLDALLKHAGIDISTIADKEALLLVKAGKRNEAIELYQDLTGATPEAALAAVDKLQKSA